MAFVDSVDLAATGTGKGAEMVGFAQLGAGASSKTVATELRKTIRADQFGPVSVTSTNYATCAADTYSPALWRCIELPNGSHALDGTVYVRRGQEFCGTGHGSTVLDFTSLEETATTAIFLGRGSASPPGSDGGGQGSGIGNMSLLGGSGAAPTVDTSFADGWKVHDIFFTGPGIGVQAGGSDGSIHDCIFELGLNHIVVNGFNLRICNNTHYSDNREGNYHITLEQNSTAIQICSSRFEYFRMNAILFQTGAASISNILVSDCSFEQNAQLPQSEGAISIRASAAELTLNGSTFRNLHGAGLISFDPDAVVDVAECVFDGRKGRPGNDQSSTMQGIKWSPLGNASPVSITGSIDGSTLDVTTVAGVIEMGMEIDGTGVPPKTRIIGFLTGTGGTGTCTVNGNMSLDVMAGTIMSARHASTLVVHGGNFRNLPGIPVEITGEAPTTVIIEGAVFTGNTGGAADIVFSNAASDSKLVLINCRSDRELVNATGSGIVSLVNCVDNNNGNLASATSLTLPKTRDVIFITGSTNISEVMADPGNANRQVTLAFQGALTVDDTGNLKLNGPFLTTIDDTLTLATADGTSWYEVSRSAN